MTGIHFDFEAGLVLATVITGLVWLLDRLVFQRRRDPEQRPGFVVEFSRSFFPVILAVLLLRSFVVEPFRIPSGSMVPTLLEGDFILVNKFGYGLRLPVLHTEFLDLGAPERGDVAVFRWPRDPSIDFIKRIVGLPGDVVLYRDERLYINGDEVPLERLGIYKGDGTAPLEIAILYREILGHNPHHILNVHGAPSADLRLEVPPGHYFVMGDNRDHSSDSRVWGFVPTRALVGKAFLIWMSIDLDDIGLRWGRIGEVIE